jgi:NAD+ synthase
MDNKQLTVRLTQWIKDSVTSAGCKGAVLGISGGIDSAVIAVLCKRAFPQNTLSINLPCYSNEEDQQHAKLVADKFSIPYKVVNLDGIYDNFMKLLPQDKTDPILDRLSQSNLKVRLRMVTIYYYANRLKYMVVGSSNRSELSIGYFTKWGDGGVDIMPIGNLVKRQVVELAQYLDIPEEIINKPPSAGLWQGQTDEGEMGLTYKELDAYLTTGRVTTEVKNKIEIMIVKAQHKRTLPPIPDF